MHSGKFRNAFSRRKVGADFKNISLFESRIAYTVAPQNRAMMNFVAVIVFWRVVAEVFCAVIQRVSVAMANLIPLWARANKCRCDGSVDIHIDLRPISSGGFESHVILALPRLQNIPSISFNPPKVGNHIPGALRDVFPFFHLITVAEQQKASI